MPFEPSESARPAAPAPDASRRSDRARQAILSATRELVSNQGYARLSVEGIAAAAKVGKQTIYRWWPSKAAVVFDAILDVNSQHGTVTLPDTGDLESDLRLVLRETVAELSDPANERLQRAIIAEIQTDMAIAEELVRRLLRPQLDATATRIRSGIHDCQLDESVDPHLAVELLFGPIFHRWLLRTGVVDETFADSILTMVLTGIRTR